MDFKYIDLTQRTPDDDWRIAIHESGHAIAGARNSFLFEYVEVGPNEHGQVVWITNPIDNADKDYTLEQLRSWQTVYGAGAAAEFITFGEIRRHAIRCDRTCHERVGDRIRDGAREPFKSAIKRAIDVLSKAELDSLARELTKKQRLRYQDVCEIIRVAPPWLC